MYPAPMPTPPPANSDPSGPPDRPAEGGDRIAKLLARAGVASRRDIERMIEERRIALDGKPLETPATILTSLAGVTVDGQPVAAAEPARLFLYHKPPGLLVTEHDPAGRAIIYDRLPRDLPRTMPVGRLDLSTEGLLLLTTDGGLKRTLELPATGVERTYRARAYGPVTQAILEELIEGIEIEGIRYGPIDANLERRTGANVWIELTLTEGKNREVRRVLEHLGLEVSRLIRTRYGPFILGDLPPGEVGEVTARDLTNFTRTLGSVRRAKGADLNSLVAVEPRAKPSQAPAIRPEAEGRPARSGQSTPPPSRASADPRPSGPTTPRSSAGWGSRTRPSRPTEPAAAPPRRGTFRLADEPRGDRSAAKGERFRTATSHPGESRGRDTPPSRAGNAPSSTTERAPPRSGERMNPGLRRDDVRGERGTTSGRSASPAVARAPGSQRRVDKPSRTAGDPRSSRNAEGQPRQDGHGRPSAKPVKGPSGGRGHPPRPPKGKPRTKK